MTSLRKISISGMMWSFIDQFVNILITFTFGIILARLISPLDFGLIGLITIFISLSDTFVQSGFNSALIRKQDCTDKDYSTVFYFNIVVAILFYIILLLSAPAISFYFKEHRLNQIIQVLGLSLIINSFSIIQRTLLIKQIDFKKQTFISLISTLFSGLCAIIMAYQGYGFWSLVVRQIIAILLSSILLWILCNWRPLFVFSMQSFKQLFGFSYKLLISSIIDNLYRNMYLMIIGKYFSVLELGFYTKANDFSRLPSEGLINVIGRVSFPILSTIQDDKLKLKSYYRKLIRSTMLITFVLMLGLVAVAEPLVISLIGEKWRPAIIYLQLLSLVGMLYPLHVLNLNMLQLLGRSDLFLKLEVIKKIISIPIIIVGLMFGVKEMIIGMIFSSFFAYYLNSYWSGKLIGYSIRLQLLDIIPSFILAVIMCIGLILFGLTCSINYILLFSIQIIGGIIFIISFCEFSKNQDYIFLKGILLDFFKKKV
jgi:teichuronic acid exporter